MYQHPPTRKTYGGTLLHTTSATLQKICLIAALCETIRGGWGRRLGGRESRRDGLAPGRASSHRTGDARAQLSSCHRRRRRRCPPNHRAHRPRPRPRRPQIMAQSSPNSSRPTATGPSPCSTLPEVPPPAPPPPAPPRPKRQNTRSPADADPCSETLEAADSPRMSIPATSQF